MSLFSLRIQSLRRDKGESQQEVADYLGVQRATYSGYERGIIVPPYEKIKKLADYYGVTVSYLMGETNFKTFDISNEVDDGIPDIKKQLQLISDELLSNITSVRCDSVLLTDDEKKNILPFIDNCIKMIDVLTHNKKGGEVKYGKY